MIRLRNGLVLGAVAGLIMGSAGVPRVAAQQAATPPEGVRRMSLAEALERLDTHNLELRLAREEMAAVEARITTAGARPNPGVSTMRDQLSGDLDDYRETTVTLGQTLQLGGQRGLRRDAARQSAEAARSRLEGTRLRLAFEIHRAHLHAAAAEADLAVLVEATEVFRRVAEAGASRFAEGDLSRYDRDRLQLERARYEMLLAAAGMALAHAARELAVLVEPDSVARPTPILPAERLDDLLTVAAMADAETALLAAAAAADVRAAEAEIEAAEAALALQRRLRIPDVALSGGFKHQTDGYEGAVVGISIPLPLWDRNRGGITEAEANLNASRVRRELAFRHAEGEIRRAWETRRSLEERLFLLGETLQPASGGLLATASVAYAEGEMSLIELLDAAAAYRDARESAIDLTADYMLAVYDLERATGRLLEPQPAAAAFR